MWEQEANPVSIKQEKFYRGGGRQTRASSIGRERSPWDAPWTVTQSTRTQRRSHFSENKCRCPPLLERQLPKTKVIFQVIKNPEPTLQAMQSFHLPEVLLFQLLMPKKSFFFFVVTITPLYLGEKTHSSSWFVSS